MISSLVLICCVFCCSCWAFIGGQQVPFYYNSDQETPKANWPATFSVDFSEKTIGWRQTFGSYIYDSSQEATLIKRKDGSLDRYCSSLFRGKTPCNHLVVDGVRWLVLPEKKYCCKCCTNKGGCGIVKSSWLDGAEYLGEERCNKQQETMCYKWNQPGLQPNYYWEEKQSKTPRRLLQMPNDDMKFNPETFDTSKIPEETFQVPDYCYSEGSSPVQCPRYSVCAALE